MKKVNQQEDLEFLDSFKQAEPVEGKLSQAEKDKLAKFSRKWKIYQRSVIFAFSALCFYMLSPSILPWLLNLDVIYRTSDSKFYRTMRVEAVTYPSMFIYSDANNAKNLVKSHQSLKTLLRDVQLHSQFNGIENRIVLCTPKPSRTSIVGFLIPSDLLYWEFPLADCEADIKHRQPGPVDIHELRGTQAFTQATFDAYDKLISVAKLKLRRD